MNFDFTEKLIQEVRNRPVLYLTSHPDHKNLIKKNDAWREIRSALNEEVATLKAKWRNLKDTYTKYLKYSKQSNDQASQKLKNWVWANELNFLDPSNTLNQTQEISFLKVECEDDSTNSTFNREETAQDSDSAQESGTQETQNVQQIYRRRQKRNNVEPTDRMILYSQKRTIDRNNEGKIDVLKCDGVDLLFLGYADTFKNLSKRKQVKVKFDIARVLMEAELADLENAT